MGLGGSCVTQRGGRQQLRPCPSTPVSSAPSCLASYFPTFFSVSFFAGPAPLSCFSSPRCARSREGDGFGGGGTRPKEMRRKRQGWKHTGGSGGSGCCPVWAAIAGRNREGGGPEAPPDPPRGTGASLRLCGMRLRLPRCSVGLKN